MRTRSFMLTVIIAAVACGSTPPAPTVDPALLEGPSRSRAVDRGALIEEVSDSRLADVLDDAGFAGGNERTWTDRQGEIWQTVVRAMRFGSPDGAARYLAWLDANAGSLIGPATRIGSAGTLAFEHEASDCCPNKDGPRALAATAEGDLVWTVMLTGPAADAAGAVALLPTDGST